MDFEPFGEAAQGQASAHETLVERLGERLDLDPPPVEGERRRVQPVARKTLGCRTERARELPAQQLAGGKRDCEIVMTQERAANNCSPRRSSPSGDGKPDAVKVSTRRSNAQTSTQHRPGSSVSFDSFSTSAS